jgi:Polysaccharide deacetylase
LECGSYNQSILASSRIIGAFVLLTSIICCQPAVAQQRMVAITFDDIPIAPSDIPASGTINPIGAQAINRAILDSLRRHKVPSTGFVVEKRVEDSVKFLARKYFGSGSTAVTTWATIATLTPTSIS